MHIVHVALIVILVMVVLWNVQPVRFRLHPGIGIHRCLRLLFIFSPSEMWLAPSTPIWISHTLFSKSESSDKWKGGGWSNIVYTPASLSSASLSISWDPLSASCEARSAVSALSDLSRIAWWHDQLGVFRRTNPTIACMCMSSIIVWL